MDTHKFDTCINRTKYKLPATRPPKCGMCPDANEPPPDVYKCIALLIEGITPDVCLACNKYIPESDGSET